VKVGCRDDKTLVNVFDARRSTAHSDGAHRVEMAGWGGAGGASAAPTTPSIARCST
jgi:hypothetical protein